ncbi:hypothetical protein KGQ27_02745 [Patescibacteria group bacterium]|nr:hypothetical protein [Patescibacteria group bacterium]MDE1946786.1 hypothetical protein [Patescibacteria group bacterium]MDE2011082.1 hypothetical protein [Patescibacteria group bacterium]MDE2233139.1 hypothetical protein [Patescibacteria group bacterium]
MMELPKRIHVIGICGVATSALAVALHKVGVKVTGSDKGFYPPVSTYLAETGVEYYAGWHPDKMVAGGVPEAIIVGTASGSRNPETVYAKEHGIPIYSFAGAIGEFFTRKNNIVCAGTWGKTSSAALLSFIIDQAGYDPSYMFGGISLSHQSAKLAGGDWGVFEGDEYKSSPTDPTAKFFYYKPTHLLLTAVSWDHADLYPTEESYFKAFGRLIVSMPKTGFIVANTNAPGVSKVLGDYRGKAISYGKSGVEYSYENVRQSENGIYFTIKHGHDSFDIHSPMIGAFQAENITGCFAMAHSIGINPETIIKAVARFKGLKRRLEKRMIGDPSNDSSDGKGVTVFDDIAHSPEKAASVLRNLREIYSGKIIAVFEPNIGGRSRKSTLKYDRAFKDADIVVIPRLTKLKTVEDGSEKSNTSLEGAELAEIIGKTHHSVHYFEDDEEVVSFLKSQTVDGDIIVFLGSHGFRGMIEETISPRQLYRP